MKSFTVGLLLALLLQTSISIPVHIKSSADKTWGNLMLKLASLHEQAGGPLDDLMSGLKDVLTDLQNQEGAAHDEYQQLSIDHDKEVKELEDAITNAESDIAHTELFLQQTLYVQQEQLSSEKDNLMRNIDAIANYQKEEEFQRNKEHEQYENHVREIEEGIDGIDQAQELLNGLRNNFAVLAQDEFQEAGGQIKAQLDRVINTMKSNKADSADDQMVEILITISEKDYADSGTVDKISNLLTNIRAQMNDHLNTTHQDEQKAQEMFQDDMDAKSSESDQLQAQLVRTSGELEATERFIDNNEDLLSTRKGDLSSYKQFLEDEQASYDKATTTYNDLIEQLHNEQKACTEATQVINSGGLQGWMADKLNGDLAVHNYL